MYEIKNVVSVLRDKLVKANGDLEVATKRVEKLEEQLDYLKEKRG